MHRPLLIVAAFLLVTGGLIFLQPKQPPSQPLAETSQDTPAPAPVVAEPRVDVAEVTPFTRPQTVATAEPSAPTPEEPAIEVTRAAPITLTNRPAEEAEAEPLDRDEMLFGRLAEDRPNLLTATRRAPDGTLRPSLLQIGTETVATAPSAPPVAVAPAPSTIVAAPPVTAAPTSDEPLTLESFAATKGAADLRSALAAAPTQAVHTVRLGDSLTTLALRYYNDPTKGDLIFEANRRVLSSRSLTVGQLLRIPELSNL